MCWKTSLVFPFPLILLLNANIEEVDVMVVVIWKVEVAAGACTWPCSVV
jgi:hypothetical protein